jgi:cell wall-associated NlpC family hydrolase
LSEIPSTKNRKFSIRRSNVLSVAVAAVFVPGLFATVALPAYAYSPTPATSADSTTAALQRDIRQNAQSVAVSASVPVPSAARDGFATTSAAEVQRAALAAAYSSYSGPSVADFLANPPYPSFSLDQVAAVALQYQGVPYVYGGSNPSGFDCSGFVMFVYAQFGIALPHSAYTQGQIGTPIALDAALPGDVIIMDGHDGFYMGNGMILDAPQPGGVVSVRKLWTNNYFVVRFGI